MIWLKNCLLDVKQQSLIHSLIHPKINRKRQNYGKKKGGGNMWLQRQFTIHKYLAENEHHMSKLKTGSG
jgi:hypothetical protein